MIRGPISGQAAENLLPGQSCEVGGIRVRSFGTAGDGVGGYGVVLLPVMARDLPQLRRWRNSDDIRLQMVDTGHIGAHQQRCWFEHCREQGGQRHWVLRAQRQRAGYVNLKSPEPAVLTGQSRVDTGLYVAPSAVRHPMLALSAALCQLDYAFELQGVQSVCTQVRQDNHAALGLDQYLGYRQVGRSDGFIRLELSDENYRVARDRLRRFYR
ncbi:hypothetical protein NFHSH190041_11840 [Shewanella sp. NFH-SH190041]|nr:hypothetical protein NFHSH190041_11840 [Shewanella sp. NFH-SH190041]